MHTYIHGHAHIHTHARTHTHTHSRSHTHAYTCMYTYMCTCMYTHSLSLTYIHIYIQYIGANNRSGEVKLKPVVIDDYNQHMVGVDKLDQFASYYSFLHKSVKWWRKIFWMLEVAVINSYIIYKKLVTSRGRRPMTHKAFRQALIDCQNHCVVNDSSEQDEDHHRVRIWKGFIKSAIFQRRAENAKIVAFTVTGHLEVLDI